MKFVGTLWHSRFLEHKCQEVGRPYVIPWHLSHDDGPANPQPATITVLSAVPYATCLYSTRVVSAYHPWENSRRMAIHPKAGRILLDPVSSEKVFTELESGAALKSLVTPRQQPFSLAPFTPGEIVIIGAFLKDTDQYEDVELLQHWVPREDYVPQSVPLRIPATSIKAAAAGKIA